MVRQLKLNRASTYGTLLQAVGRYVNDQTFPGLPGSGNRLLICFLPRRNWQKSGLRPAGKGRLLDTAHAPPRIRSFTMFLPKSSGMVHSSGLRLSCNGHLPQRKHMASSALLRMTLIRAVRWFTSDNITATNLPEAHPDSRSRVL